MTLVDANATRSKNPSGICASCGGWFERVESDHVTPLFEGGAHDTSNLQWLCAVCHGVKTRAEQSRSYQTRLREGRAPQDFVTAEGVARRNAANVGRRHTAEAKARMSAACVEREARKREVRGLVDDDAVALERRARKAARQRRWRQKRDERGR